LRSEICPCRTSCSLLVEDWICLFIMSILVCSSFTSVFLVWIFCRSFSISKLWLEIVLSISEISFSLVFFVFEIRVALHRLIVVSSFWWEIASCLSLSRFFR